MKRYIRPYHIIFVVIFLLNCLGYVRKQRVPRMVRVAIVCGAESIRIKEADASQTEEILINHRFPMYYRGGVYVNGRKYRGTVVLKKIGGKLWAINVLKIEDYLKGVVPAELGKITPNLLAAAKAQAVAARTYTYAHLNNYQELGFDLYATVQDQVYLGESGEDSLINIAIEQTRGEILVYHNKPIEAKYHSTCGGRTADFNDAWPGPAPPYLRSVRCPYCSKSPHFRWQKTYLTKEFFPRLRENIKKVGIVIPLNEVIKSLRILRNPRSGRIRQLVVITTRRKYAIPGYDVRSILGSPQDPGGLLPSNYIYFKIKGENLIIEGRGFGHGVGMCQFGALEMARQGKNYREILRHYYPGTRIIKGSELRSSRIR